MTSFSASSRGVRLAASFATNALIRGVVLPFVLDVVERWAGPHGSHRDFRHFALRTWPIRIAGIGRKAALGRGRQREQRARDDPPIHVSPPAGAAAKTARRIIRQDGANHEGCCAAGNDRERRPAGTSICHRGAIAMPQGSSPTWIVLTTFCAATSITETSLETPLVVSRYFSSGVKAMCQTRCPTSRYLVTV